MEKLDGLSVKNAISEKYSDKFRAEDDRYTSICLKLYLYRKWIHQNNNQTNTWFFKGGPDIKMGIVKSKEEKDFWFHRKSKEFEVFEGPRVF